MSGDDEGLPQKKARTLCQFTQSMLLDDHSRRLNAEGKSEKFPQSRRWLVYYDESKVAWACSECLHLVSEHGTTSTLAVSPQMIVWDSGLYSSIANAKEGVEDRCSGIALITCDRAWLGLTKSHAPDTILIRRRWCEHFWALHRDHMCEQQSVIAIIGTPGIGKTVALNYLLFKHLNLESPPLRYVAVIFPNAGTFYVFDTKGKTACSFDLLSRSQLRSCLSSFKAHILVLHDLGNEPPQSLESLPTVLATSPDSRKYKERMKGDSWRYYVPLPNDAEMEVMAKTVFKSSNYADKWPMAKVPCGSWQEVAYYFGNVPRSVFISDHGSDELENQLSAAGAAAKLNGTGYPERRPELYDMLVVYQPTDASCKHARISFHKGYVADVFGERCFNQ